MPQIKRTGNKSKSNPTKSYRHPESDSPMRPDVGTQPQFKKTKPPKTYRFDSSLSPALDWDGQNPAREQGEAAIREVLEAKSLEQAKFAATKLKALGKPFLNWAGKAERLSFDVPTLPLFIHERHSTKAIIETLKGHRSDKQMEFDEFFSDPRHSITDQVLKAYEHRDQWVNRMILGRLAGRDELAAALRGPWRTGPDDLYGSTLRREVREQLPALHPSATKG